MCTILWKKRYFYVISPCCNVKMGDIHEAVHRYFEDSLTYTEILEVLRVRHNCDISASTLKDGSARKE